MSRAYAIDNLRERLKMGGSVGGRTLADLIDADLNGPRCEEVTNDVIAILLSDYPDTPLKQDAYTERLIADFFKKPEIEVLIQEEAAMIAAEAPEVS